MWRQKTATTPLRAPTRRGRWTLAENDEPTLGASRGELYLLALPCDLLLTAALEKVAKEDVEDSKESSLILTIAIDNRE